jgi:hypothetical protein
VLDHVERRGFLVEPAGEGSAVAAFAVAHVELDEGAGQLLHLPGRGRLAGAQAHDHVAGPHRLTGSQAELAHLPVALVEQAQGGDPLRHRRGAGRQPGHGLWDVDGLHFGGEVLTGPIDLRRARGAAGGQRGEGEEADVRPAHAPSGVQA